VKRFFILCYNPKFVIVTQVENAIKQLKNETGDVIVPLMHMDETDMPVYLIGSEGNRIREISKDDETLYSPSEIKLERLDNGKDV
jgi:hypothetical protein